MRNCWIGCELCMMATREGDYADELGAMQHMCTFSNSHADAPYIHIYFYEFFHLHSIFLFLLSFYFYFCVTGSVINFRVSSRLYEHRPYVKNLLLLLLSQTPNDVNRRMIVVRTTKNRTKKKCNAMRFWENRLFNVFGKHFLWHFPNSELRTHKNAFIKSYNQTFVFNQFIIFEPNIVGLWLVVHIEMCSAWNECVLNER